MQHNLVALKSANGHSYIADYYRKTEILSTSQECRGWATATLVSVSAAVVAGLLACFLSFKLRHAGKGKADPLVSIHSAVQTPITVRSKSKICYNIELFY